MKRLVLFCLFLSSLVLLLSGAHAQDQKASREQVNQWLKTYLSQQDMIQYMNPINQIYVLRQEGVDPVPFALGMIADIQYAEFWNEGMKLYSAALFTEEQFVKLAESLIQWLEREEPIYTSPIILFKSSCVNYLVQMVGPNLFQNPELKSKILVFSHRFFQDGEPTKPEYWFQKFGLTYTASQPNDSLSKDESEAILWSESTARLCVQFASCLYNATADERFLKIVENCLQSDYIQIKNTAQFTLSDTCRKTWRSGEYELFATIDPRKLLPPEEWERLKNMKKESTRPEKTGR